MVKKIRISLLYVLLAGLLVGCGAGAFGGVPTVREDIDSTQVVRNVRFFDEGDIGNLYEVSLTVPDTWVGDFETVTDFNTITFRLKQNVGRNATIFTIHALSRQQFWEQNGSYPTQYSNIANRVDTYFVYYAPLENFYTGLSEAEFQALRSQIDAIIATFDAVAIEMGASA